MCQATDRRGQGRGTGVDRRREVGEKGGALLIHRKAVPLSRCGSGTLGLFHSPGVKFSPLVPLRYPQEKAKKSGS